VTALERLCAWLVVIGVVIFMAAAVAGCAPKVETRGVAKLPLENVARPVAPRPLDRRPADARDALEDLLGRWCEAVAYVTVADPLLAISAGQAPAQLVNYPECSAQPPSPVATR